MKNERTKTEKEFLDEISIGKYKDQYLVYARKSTDEAENQRNSLDYQVTEDKCFADKQRLSIAQITIKGFCTNGIIQEKHSGFSESDEFIINEDGTVQLSIARPKFQHMVRLLNNGQIKGIICLCWDRISRNKSDEVIVRKLMRNGADFRFVWADYAKGSSGELHMDIDGMFAVHHSRVTSEKVSKTTEDLRSKGVCTYRAPIGYLNQGNMHSKPFDPVRAPVIKEIFELYATGKWSLSDLARYANEQGVTTMPQRRRRTDGEMLDEEQDVSDIPKTERPLEVCHISRILTNPFYTGKILTSSKTGVYIQSVSHEALVTNELFDDVQKLLKKKTVSKHYDEKLNQPLRGVVRCAHCERVYTPYTKKGIQYYNARCKDDCLNTFKNFNFKFIDEQIGRLLSNLYFTDAEMEQMDARAGTDIALLEEKRHKELASIERQKKKLREDLLYIRTNKLTLLKTGVYTAEALAEEETKLSAELATFQLKEEASDIAMHEMMQEVYKLSELVKNVALYWQHAIVSEKEEIVRIIFSELKVSDNTIQYKAKSGFQAFENRFLAICDPTENRTPL